MFSKALVVSAIAGLLVVAAQVDAKEEYRKAAAPAPSAAPAPAADPTSAVTEDEDLEDDDFEAEDYETPAGRPKTAKRILGIGRRRSWLIDCNDGEKSDLSAARNFANSHWSGLEKAMEDATGKNIKSCLRKRFKKNGRIVCEDHQRGNCGHNVWGWAVGNGVNHKAHLCPNFLNDVKDEKAADRVGSYLALMAHEWAHTCLRGEQVSDKIDQAVWKYYKSKTSGVTRSECITCGF